MKNILVIHNQSAMNTLSGKEALDFSLIFGSYEQDVTVLFYGQGATQVLAHQDPELIGQKDYLSTIKALDIYDIEKVYVCQTSLQQMALAQHELIADVTPITMDKISELKRQADHIYVI